MIPCKRVHSSETAQTRADTAERQSRASATWYHGSPLLLDTLSAGSTVTPYRELATVFSHKPELVELRDDGTLRHNGQLSGYLYVVLATGPGDLEAHPHSSMPGCEWLTRRDLPLTLLEQTHVNPSQIFSADEEIEMRKRLP